MCSNAACTSLQARDPFEQEVHNLWNSDPGKKRKTKAPKARPPNNNPKKTKPPNNKPNPHLNQVCYLSKRIVQRGYPHPPPLAARTERGPSSIDRALASSPPREPSLSSRDGAAKARIGERKRAPVSVARRSKSGVRSVDREGRQGRRTCGSILGQEPRAWFQWYTLLVFFFLARQAHTPGRPDAADSSGWRWRARP